MMLLGGRHPDLKQVAIVTRDLRFKMLLSSILNDWKFTTVEDLSAAQVVLAEHGMKLPAHASEVVWLTPLPLAAGSCLPTPISLTTLYQLLEGRYFPTPRRHIRVAMKLPIVLKVADARQTGSLVSLSDRGGRIRCADEIARGSLLQLEVKLAGRTFITAAEVLYCIPAGDSSGRLQPQVGVLFKATSDQEINMLRGFVEKTCIEHACARENISVNDPCLSWLAVPADPWYATA